MSGDITVSENMLDSLRATRPWVKFLSILGFVGCDLMLLAALVVGAGSSMLPPSAKAAGFGPGIAILYIVFAAFYFFPCLFMFQYAAAIGRIGADGQPAMEEALAKQKSVWKFAGVVALVILSLEVVVILFAILAGVVASMAHH